MYLDVDSSRAFGMGVMLYHVKGDPVLEMEDSDLPQGINDTDDTNLVAWLKKVKDFKANTIELILFLSKNLTPPERRYVPTELEMAGVAWAICKVRYIIEGTPKTYVFTDHSAVTAIARQKHLTGTESLAKLNLRLTNASIYIQQFPNLDVRYRPGRCHLVPDALGRLDSTEPPGDATEDTLDDLPHVFHARLVEMSQPFKDQLQQAYQDDPVWKRVMDVVTGMRDDNEYPPLPDDADAGSVHTLPTSPAIRHRPMAGLQFSLKDGYLYYHDKDEGKERLYVLKALAIQIFRQAHDETFHQGYHQAYERIRASFYIHRLAHELKAYICHCPQCLLNQTRRHQRYGDLQPVSHPGRPFETICIDIVTGMPETSTGMNAFTTETCHVSKMINIEPGRKDWGGQEWGTALVQGHYKRGWGLWRGLISDRDKRFLQGVFAAMMKAFGGSFFSTAAWHPEADGQSERTNQTVEIALRYFVTENPDADWTEAVAHIQFMLNCSPNASTGVAPFEYVYGFVPYCGFDLVQERDTLSCEEYESLRLQVRD